MARALQREPGLKVRSRRKGGFGRMTLGERIYQIFALITVGLISLTCIIPAYYVIVTSFTSKLDLQTHNGFVIIPHELQFQAYAAFFRSSAMVGAFEVSLARVIMAVILQLLVCSLAAYTLCKVTLPGRKALLTLVIVSMLIGPGMIPGYLWAIQNGTFNTFWIYVLPQSYSAFGIILFRQFFLGLPDSLLESAHIDGATEAQTMRHIILPLSAPIFATIALFCAVGNWNDFMTNMIYVRKPELMTMAFYLQQTLTGVIDLSQQNAYNGTSDRFSNVSNGAPTESYKMAAVLISTLPIVAVYPFLQKHFATGMLTGAIKG